MCGLATWPVPSSSQASWPLQIIVLDCKGSQQCRTCARHPSLVRGIFTASASCMQAWKAANNLQLGTSSRQSPLDGQCHFRPWLHGRMQPSLKRALQRQLFWMCYVNPAVGFNDESGWLAFFVSGGWGCSRLLARLAAPLKAGYHRMILQHIRTGVIGIAPELVDDDSSHCPCRHDVRRIPEQLEGDIGGFGAQWSQMT